MDFSIECRREDDVGMSTEGGKIGWTGDNNEGNNGELRIYFEVLWWTLFALKADGVMGCWRWWLSLNLGEENNRII